MIDQSEPASFEDLLLKGSNYLRQGQLDEARKLLVEAHRLNPNNEQAAMNLGSAFILSGSFKEAVPIYESLSAQAPDNPMIWTNLGAAYLGNPIVAQDDEQLAAIGAFKQALALDSTSPGVAYNLGLIYRDRQEYDQAIYWFGEAIKVNPKDKDARKLRKRLLEKIDPDRT